MITTILFWLAVFQGAVLALYALCVILDYNTMQKVIDDENRRLTPITRAANSMIGLVVLCLAYTASVSYDEQTARIAELEKQIERSE